jgi:predicted DNA-binding transcriptional regulator AlpA
MAADDYLTEQEFCRRYKISISAAQRWRYIGDGGPKYVRLGFRRIGYRLTDCEAWAAASTFEHRAAELAHRVAD